MEDMGPTAQTPEHTREHPLSTSVLVLNRNYTAVRVVTARRAFILLCKQQAEAIDARDEEFRVFDFSSWLDYSQLRVSEAALEDLFVRTPRISILVPRVIRLVSYDKIPKREVKFSRKNILARDGNRCQYCGKRLPASQLSLDHVHPKSRGGKSSWTNVVTACNPCNTRKGGRLPAEASMKLRCVPAAPKRNPILQDKVNTRMYQVWKMFLSEGDLALEA
jgi:5-methylcytosine-specific restriction endonuclease McrA